MTTKNKKGLSAVVTLMLMVLLVLAATGIIWATINKTIKEEMGSSKSCYDILGKITLNSEYTCYNSSNDRVLFSINIGDAEIDELIASITNEGYSTIFELSNEKKTIEGLKNYPDPPGSLDIQLPGKNTGKTYIAENILEEPVKIEIASVIEGKTCESSDSLTNIPLCWALSL